MKTKLILMLGAVALFASEASAQTGKAECLDAHVHGQELRAQRQWRAAREAFRTCSSSTCPEVVRVECARWLDELTAQQPSVLFVVRDGAAVTLDSATIDVSRGTAIEVDPGAHKLHVEASGFAPYDETLTIREGEAHRRVEIRLDQIATPSSSITLTPPIAKSSPPIFAWVASGLAVATLGTGMAFGFGGLSIENNRASTCAPWCSSDQLAPIRTDYLVADIFFGATVVLTALAVTLFVVHKRPSQTTTSMMPIVRF